MPSIVLEAEEDQAVEKKPAFYTVAIFLVDRAFGGPEEGGWWFNCGQRVDDRDEHGLADIPALAYSLEQAAFIADGANERLNAGVNKGRRSISSVLSEGVYRAEVHEGYPPTHWPETTPHYE